MAGKNKTKVEAVETTKTEPTKLEVAAKTLTETTKKEAEKQKGIYQAMKGLTIVRN